jgi:hypothetical protein
MLSSKAQRRRRKTKEMASCNSPIEMQLLQSSANGNVDGNGKTAQAT